MSHTQAELIDAAIDKAKALLDERDALRAAALNALQFVEDVGCRCPNCEVRIQALHEAIDPFLPSADDVLGIFAP